MHGTLARIETLPEEFDWLMAADVQERVYDALTSPGFSYVALNLGGYRTGA